MPETETDSSLETVKSLLDASDGKLMVSVDADVFAKEEGPSTEPHDGVLEGLESLLERGVPVVMNSGRPIGYLQEMRQDWADRGFDLGSMDIIGGQGTYYSLDGDVKPVFENDGDYRDYFHSIHREIFRTAADQNWQIRLQDNRSWRAGVVRTEAEGGNEHSRGNTTENPVCSDASTREQWERYFEKMPGFEYDENHGAGAGREAIILKYPWDSDLVGYLAHVMRREEPFVGNRMEWDDEGRLAFYRDGTDEPAEDVEERMEEAVRGAEADVREVMHRPDGGTEFVLDHAGKDAGLEKYLEDRYGEPVTVIHGGDGESDVLDPGWVVTAAQEGEPSQEICSDGDEPYLVVEDAGHLARLVGYAVDETGYDVG